MRVVVEYFDIANFMDDAGSSSIREKIKDVLDYWSNYKLVSLNQLMNVSGEGIETRKQIILTFIFKE